jgi:dipeptidyl aminopeptidase/acylaminoacyl peptidase
MKIWFALYFFFIQGGLAIAQDSLKTLDHSDFLIWNSIHDQQISFDGSLITYRIVPGEGDPKLVIHHKADGFDQVIHRVSRSQIDYDGGYVYGLITPHRDSLRLLERRKTDKKEWPADTLFIYHIANRTIHHIPYGVSFKSPVKTGGWLAYTLKKDAFPKDTTVKEKKEKKEIVHLIVRHLGTGREDTLKSVKEFTWAEEAAVLMAIVETADSLLVPGVYMYKEAAWKRIKRQKGEYTKLSLSPDGQKSSFVAHHDTTKAQILPWQLYYFDFTTDSAYQIAHRDETTLPMVSQHADLKWSEDSRYLFYGRAELPVIRDTSLLEDETVNVEIWRTSDPVLYTVQNVNKPEEEKKAYTYVFDTNLKKHIQINSPAWETAIFTRERNHRYALVYTEKPYQLSVTWLGDAAKDLAVVDIQTGQLAPFRKDIVTSPRLSPGGKYAYGYSERDSTWWVYHIITGIFSLMNTKGIPSFYDELNDVPGFPNSYGSAGWTQNDEDLIIYDRYDMWSWSPLKGRTPVRLTNGREFKNIFRYIHTDIERDALSATEPWLTHVTDGVSKSSGYAWYHPVNKNIDTLSLHPFEFSRQVVKARAADTYLYRKENFQTFPNLEISDDGFITSHVISDANPQLKNYKWGTIRIIEWMDWDSTMRRGLLVLPYGYDTLRSYPTIVNFYERYTDALHKHPNIEPHRSTINYAFYASRGYVIFNPDITYKVGYPGQSAYEAVMSGVEYLVKKRIADANNLALQGHSWGGYQIAYILTRTDQFKCAEAGASVVNMTSAYGGIRWGTGLSRMFQYEQAQSRIGKTLWQDPQRYIMNSPLFKADKINTPLLLLHNDEDSAVPFEQGIEFYLALRRLGKTAWLLNYRGEPHWPVKWHNRKDFQLRMSQFFDHYLQGKPMPKWMAEGVPALRRGVDPGY